MKLVVKRNRELAPINSQNTQNENKAEIIELIVPEEFESFNKKIVFITPNKTVWDVIVNNQYKITNAITQYDKVDYYIWLTKEVDGESIDFRTKTKTLNFYHNEDASDEITEEEIHGVNTVVNLLEEEIEKVENLNIEATKIGNTTTVTITKKDGTTESVEINDGADGQDGYTPQKGIDYFTEQDIEEIETNVKNDIEENVLVNYSLIAETGAKIELSINQTNYKLTAILKDKNNNIIHTSNVIDLPLETMVVNATYDNTTKKIILTLQNGTTVEFSVADLVSGLVSESQLQTILSNYYTKTEINNLLNNKVDKVQGKELSSNDFTDILKEKLEGLENYDDTEVKEDIEDIQDEQVEQNTDIEALQTENARLKATLPTTTGEGQDITLDKTAEMEFIKPPLPMGNSEQESREGYNLFNVNSIQPFNANCNVTIIDNKLVYTNNNSYDVTITLFDGELNAGNIYGLVNSNLSKEASIYKGNTYYNSLLTTSQKSNSVAINENGTYSIKTSCPSNGSITIDKLLISTINPNGKYEAYGATPSPEFESPIANVTGDVEVVVENKNLFDKDSSNFNASWDGGNSNQLTLLSNGNIQTAANYSNWRAKAIDIKTLKPNTQYTLSIELISATSAQVNKAVIRIPYNNGTSGAYVNFNGDESLYQFNSLGKQTFTFTTPSDMVNIGLSLNSNGSDTTAVFGNIMIEKGSTSTPYTPHKEQVFTFPLDNEKLMLGDYLADDGIHHVKGQIVIDGSETWNDFSYTDGDNNFRVQKNEKLPNILTPPTNPANLICNYFKPVNRDSAYVKSAVGIAQYGAALGTIFISAPISILQNRTMQGWKDWLTEHNLIVEYEFAEEQIVPYTSAQQEVYNQIKQAISYEEQTNISGTSDGSNPIFSVEAYQSTKLVLKEMATAIVALGGV